MFRFLSSENICAVQDLYKYMYKIFIYNGPKLEKMQISFNIKMYQYRIFSLDGAVGKHGAYPPS